MSKREQTKRIAEKLADDMAKTLEAMSKREQTKRIAEKLADDMAKTLEALSSGLYHKSVTWRLFKRKDDPNKRYSIDHLDDLLNDVKMGDVSVGAMCYTIGDLNHAKQNPDVAKFLDDVTPINLSDFVYAVCCHKDFLDTWLDEIVAVIIAPHQTLKNTPSEMQQTLVRVLYRVHQAITSDNGKIRMH